MNVTGAYVAPVFGTQFSTVEMPTERSCADAKRSSSDQGSPIARELAMGLNASILFRRPYPARL
jgi:hypothetical protein